MKACQFENLLPDFLNNDLSRQKKQEIQTHLTKCKTCPAKLQEIEKVLNILDQRERPEPPLDILMAYSGELNRIFRPPSKWLWLKEYCVSVGKFLFHSPSPALRLAKTGVLLMTGIMIGWFLFYPLNVTQNIQPVNEYSAFPVSPGELKLIHNFLIESEILLLNIANSNSLEISDSTDMVFNQEIAQRLLKQSSLIQSKSSHLQNDLLLLYMNRLELIFLEIANTPEEEIIETFQEIKEIIQESNLLFENKASQEIVSNITQSRI